MPSAEQPLVKVQVLQLDTLARMALARGWWARRRVLSLCLPEIVRHWRLAEADFRDGEEPPRMLWRRFFRPHPSFRALFLGCGAWGRKRLENPPWMS
jgi:hypothetical protein